MKSILIILLLTACGQLSETGSPEQEIQKVLDQQVSAWNDGDIDAFMETYWKSDSLVYIGSTGLRYGWQQALDGYKERYPDKRTMGTVAFELHQMTQLSDEYWQVIGAFHLTREVGDLSGYFTLLFRKIDGEWLIVADHSS